VLAVPHFVGDRHRVVTAALVQFFHKMLDLAARHDRQQGVGHLRQLGVEQNVRLVMRPLVDQQRGQQPDRRHGSGQQPHQPAAQRIGGGPVHAGADVDEAM